MLTFIKTSGNEDFLAWMDSCAAQECEMLHDNYRCLNHLGVELHDKVLASMGQRKASLATFLGGLFIGERFTTIPNSSPVHVFLGMAAVDTRDEFGVIQPTYRVKTQDGKVRNIHDQMVFV